MKHKLLVLSLTLLFACSAVVYAAGVNGQYKGRDIVQVKYGGDTLVPDSVPGYIENGSTMVPLGLLRKAGFTIDWDAKTLTATIKAPPPRTVPVLIQSQLDELSKYVYKIQAPLKDDPSMSHQGSGFLVNGVMITNYHVWDESPNIQAMIDGKWQTGEIVFSNKDVDLIGFKVSGGKELPVSTDLPQRDDPVYAIGFAHGNMSIDSGEVFVVIPNASGFIEIAHSAKTEPGESGGVLLNGKGEIIGIHKGGLDDIGFSIPIKYALDELN